jgi:hypothetical protein
MTFRKPPFELVAPPTSHVGEKYHQQYLAKNPNGYCGIGECGVPFKLGGSHKWARRRERWLSEGSVVESEGYRLATLEVHIFMP